MPDKKLTDSEIIKALRSWLEEIRKARQAYLEKVNEEHYPSMRYEYLLSDTIHEINRLQAENDRKKEKISRLQSMLIRFLNEMFEWSNKNNIDTTNFSTIPILESEKENLVKQLKAEAYKEFAKIVKANKRKLFNYIYSSTGFDNQIDNLLNEMVGEDNESKD